MKNLSAIEEFASKILDGPVEMEWSDELNECQFSRWTQAGYISGFSIVVASTASGIYHVTEDIDTFVRFVREAKPDLSDMKAVRELFQRTLPCTRHFLFEDDDGLVRHLYGEAWEVPGYRDGKLVFCCNHAERGVIERWTLDGQNVEVEDIAEGSSSLNL